jgi:hypothetical protein
VEETTIITTTTTKAAQMMAALKDGFNRHGNDGQFRLMLCNDWLLEYGNEDEKIEMLLGLYQRFVEEGLGEDSVVKLPDKDTIKTSWWATDEKLQCFYDAIKCLVVMINVETMDIPLKKHRAIIRTVKKGTPLAFVLLYDAVPRKSDEWDVGKAKALQREAWHELAERGKKSLCEPFQRLHDYAHRRDVKWEQAVAESGESLKHTYDLLWDYENYIGRKLETEPGFASIKLLPDRLVPVSYLAHLAADSRFSLGSKFMGLLTAALPKRYIYLELDIKPRGGHESLRAFYKRSGFVDVADLTANDPARLFSRDAFMSGWLGLHFGVDKLVENLIDSDPEEFMDKRFMLLDNTLPYHSTPKKMKMTLRDQYTRAARMERFYLQQVLPTATGLFVQKTRASTRRGQQQRASP